MLGLGLVMSKLYWLGQQPVVSALFLQAEGSGSNPTWGMVIFIFFSLNEVIIESPSHNIIINNHKKRWFGQIWIFSLKIMLAQLGKAYTRSLAGIS